MKDLTLISNVVSRFAAKQTKEPKEESKPLAVGDLLEVWMKRGDWWTEMRRGVKLEVKDVQGDTVRVQHRGWSEGKGWEMKIPAGQDLSGKFKLDGDDRFKRSLVVTRV
jgi:hypothetical protein